MARPTASYRFGLARINTNGTLDTSFGTGGLVQAPAFNESGVPTSHPDIVRLVDFALQPDGKIVASGWVDFETTPSMQGDYLMARYDSGLTMNAIVGYTEVDEGAAYTLYLNSTDPVTQWTIDWGDGNVENFAGNLRASRTPTRMARTITSLPRRAPTAAARSRPAPRP